MTWRKFSSEAVAGYPAVLEVRPITVGEWRKVEHERLPGSTALDVHVAMALVQGVMENPWSGPQPTA